MGTVTLVKSEIRRSVEELGSTTKLKFLLMEIDDQKKDGIYFELFGSMDYI